MIGKIEHQDPEKIRADFVASLRKLADEMEEHGRMLKLFSLTQPEQFPWECNRHGKDMIGAADQARSWAEGLSK